MKARIDTNLKTIAIDEPIALDELVKFVQALFPDEWQKWKVDTNVTVKWESNPIIVDRYPRQPWGPYWYGGGTALSDIGHVQPDNTPGTYCLSIQN